MEWTFCWQSLSCNCFVQWSHHILILNNFIFILLFYLFFAFLFCYLFHLF
jgi:hypothetical protein